MCVDYRCFIHFVFNKNNTFRIGSSTATIPGWSISRISGAQAASSQKFANKRRFTKATSSASFDDWRSCFVNWLLQRQRLATKSSLSHLTRERKKSEEAWCLQHRSIFSNTKDIFVRKQFMLRQQSFAIF